MKETTVQIVEDYLLQRSQGRIIPTDELRRRFLKAGIQEDSEHEVLIELDHEWTREEEALLTYEASKKKIVIGLLISVVLLAISIVAALGIFFQGKIIVFVFGAIATAILSALEGARNSKKFKSRVERRRAKWSVWDK